MLTSMPAIATGFVRKLYRILDQESGVVISWTRGGTAFAIFDDERLNELILPKYFRGRLCAFRQQLREHGFQQLLANELAVPIAPVATQASDVQCTYFHEHFVRGSPGRLSKITRTPLPRRRISSRKSKAGAGPGGAAGGKRASPSAIVAIKAEANSSSSSSNMSNKRARVDNNTASSSTSTVSTATLSSSSSFGSTSSSSSSSGPASASVLSSSTVPISGISIMKDFTLTATAQPVVRHQQQPQQQQQLVVKKNPLFSNESDPLFADWLSLDDISPATGTSGTGCSVGASGVTTDISFSEDVLGALMNLVNTSMSTASVTGQAAANPTSSSCGNVTSCAAQEKKICNGTSSLSTSNSNSRSVCAAKKKAMTAGAVYETHQFSEDTINSMMLWLGSSGST